MEEDRSYRSDFLEEKKVIEMGRVEDAKTKITIRSDPYSTVYVYHTRVETIHTSHTRVLTTPFTLLTPGFRPHLSHFLH